MNKVILQGHLGRDPEISYTSTGKMRAAVSVATSQSRLNKETGQWEDLTEWHSVVGWGNNAEKLSKCQKGDNVLIEGALSTRRWKAEDGRDMKATDVVAYWIRVLSRSEDRR